MSSVPDGSIGAESAHPAIEDYHEFLAANRQVAADSQEMLARLSEERLLVFRGEPFSRYLRPHFVTGGQYAVIKDVVSTLASAMIKLRRATLQDERLLAQLDLTPQERHLVMVDPGFEEPSPSARLDSFWSERDWRFVEMNAESPAAIAYEDVLAELFLELPVMKEWQAKGHYRARPLYARDRFMEAIDEVWREFRANRGASNFNERPNIAIVDWEDVATSSEFELFKQYFNSKGLNVLITAPEKLEFSGGRLRDGDFVIDIYYKRVLTSELLEKPEAARATLEAYEAGAVCVINSFRAKLLHKKMSFGLLHDEANAHLFSAHELDHIRRHIPWTRKVTEGHTTFNGRQIDLIPFIEENREQLVLKPNDEYGGKGVTIGWASDGDHWQRAITEALASPFVVQWAVHLDQESYPYYDQIHGVSFRDLTADLDPFVFGSDTQGVLTRLSAAALLNVTAGTGSVVPTMVVEKQ
jgi:glutathionylspermidine synthase